MIKLQKQKFNHDPDNGVWGDCHRTAFAMILGMDRDDVPHFCVSSNPDENQERVTAFLKHHRIVECSIPFTGDLDDLIRSRDVISPGLPYILGGRSRLGTNHSVVIYGRQMFDPSQVDSGIVGPCDDGFYWVTYLFSRIIFTADEQEALRLSIDMASNEEFYKFLPGGTTLGACVSAYKKLGGDPKMIVTEDEL